MLQELRAKGAALHLLLHQARECRERHTAEGSLAVVQRPQCAAAGPGAAGVPSADPPSSPPHHRGIPGGRHAAGNQRSCAGWVPQRDPGLPGI